MRIMVKQKRKKILSFSTMFLMLTIAVSFIAIVSEAADAATIRSFVYVGVSPKVVGIGQQVIVVTWTADMPPDVGEQNLLISSPNGRAAWNNPMIVYVTKPDGTNDTLTMPRTDPVGATWINYVPLTAGNYTLQCYFPGEFKNSSTVSSYYTPDWSPVATMTVTQDAQPTWAETPLAHDYWTRPINTANHDWSVLAGNWLGGSAQNYPRGSAGITSTYVGGQGTETSHILWTRQYYAGGYGEDTYGSIGLQTTHYQGINWAGLVLNGQLHFSPRFTAHGTKGWEIVDLYTGELLSLDYNSTMPSYGQVYNYESPNQHGGFTYLWRTSGVVLPEIVQLTNATQFVNGSVVNLGLGTSTSGYFYTVNRTSSKITTIGTTNVANPITTTTNFGTVWEMLDGYTEQTVCYIANVSSGGTAVYGKDGSILRYSATNLGNTTNPNYYLQVWNTSAGTMPSSQLGTGYWQWRPAGGTFGGASAYLGTLAYNYVHDGRNFYSLNVTMPSLLGTRNNVSNQTASLSVVKEGEYAVFIASGFNNGTHTAPGFVLTVNLQPGQEGKQISRQEFVPPSSADAETVSLTGVYPEDNMICFSKAKTLERFGYSMDTGQLVWTSPPEVQFMYYGMSTSYYNHTLFSHGYGGVITAYDIKTGQIKWTYEPLSVSTESAYGGVYTTGISFFSGDKLYTVSGEHSPTQPLYRGPNLRCIDVNTGKEVWKILGFFGGMSPTSSNILMADGILVGLNYFDMQLYAFGRGPSAVTVDATGTSVNGDPIEIKGTVTDQSPYGRRDTNNILDFSLKGTPAISDNDMQAWMEYKYMQQALPTNAKGVEVHLQAIDPNGNLQDIGTVTSNSQGNFATSYVPQIPGDYQVIASFQGSKAYGPSSATTFLTVESSPEATVGPTEQPQSVSEQYFVPAIAALAILIVILIVVVAFVLVLMLKKRP
jgi:hypothetical protein